MEIKTRMAQRIRDHVRAQLYDESGRAAQGTAIYTLSDPRDIRVVRYVGQTGNPRRRFRQHLSTARLWLPDEVPWWVQSPKLRPLYDWIRELYRDGERLPVMIVTEWVQNTAQVRMAERKWIMEYLQKQMPVLNIEREVLGRQMQLI